MNPMEELQYETVKVLQKVYEHLTEEELTVLLIATGIPRELAFPWHNEERKAA